MRFIHSDKNSKAIEKLLTSKKNLKCAVAFWGSNAEGLLSNASEKTQIICNLESGATNPYVIERLIKQGIQIKTNKRLHAKVYIAENERAIVGSANASANGLSYEGSQVSGWSEASILVKDEKTLSEINKWFLNQWGEANKISEQLIRDAKITWKKKRNAREFEAKENKSILSCLRKDPEQFKDKNIYISIYRIENATKEAENKFLEVEKQLNINKKLSFWEDWSDLPEDSKYISLYYGPRQGFRFEGFYNTFSPAKDYIESFELDDGTTEEILIYFIKDSIDGMVLSEEDQSTLKNNIESLWKSRQPQANDEAVCIPLYDARKILF